MPSIRKTSAVAIVRNHTMALLNLIEILCNSGNKPDELVIIHINEPILPLQAEHFDIVSVRLNCENPRTTVNAKNLALTVVRNSNIIFYDLDYVTWQALTESKISILTYNNFQISLN